MTLSEQERFCSEHKKDEARKEWNAEKYPDIDWLKLDARITPHIDDLKKILSGEKDSYYRDILVGDIKDGKVRNIPLANYLPGYYGSKGFRVMLEGVSDKLSSLLRTMTPKDRLVSAKGPVFYVQAVLVPELATRLVMEDMDVGEKKAREILEESRHVGMVLCVDEGDIVDDDFAKHGWF